MITEEFVNWGTQQEQQAFLSKMEMESNGILKSTGKTVWGHTQTELDEIKQYPCLSAYEDAKHKEWLAKQKAKKEAKPTKPEALVTKDTLKKMLENSNPAYVEAVIGRALVALFKRQTESEQATNDTKENNGIGFAGCDAEYGSISAKYYLKTGHLKDFAIEAWLKSAKNGYPRLCKYAKQLNEEAMKKAVAQ